MANSDAAGTPERWQRSLLSLLRESGDALESAVPPFDPAAGAARLRAAAHAQGLLVGASNPEHDLAVTGARLEDKAPSFDAEAAASRLREAARSRQLIPSVSAPPAFEGSAVPASQHSQRDSRQVPTATDLRVLNGRYRLQSSLGTGGMGSVWLAEDTVLARTVALKELVHVDNARGERRTRAVREARALARVMHPAIVSIHDIIFDEDDPWIVMDYIKGRSLASIIRDGPLDEVSLARIVLPILRGLSAAHEAGVVHRDVKPANILVNEGGEVVLVDFGLAKITGDIPLDEAKVLGTPEFLAPEQVTGDALGPAADLWSLGVTIFCALEGYSPFLRHSHTVAGTMLAILSDNPPRLTRPGVLAAIVPRLLEKNPSDRASADRLTSVLESILQLSVPAPATALARAPDPDPPSWPVLQGSSAILSDDALQVARRQVDSADTEAAVTMLLAMPEQQAAAILSGYPARKASVYIEAMAASRPVAIGSILRMLSSARGGRAVDYLSPRTAAVILAAMPAGEAARILSSTSPRTAAGVIMELPPSVSAQLIGVMPASRAAEVLQYVEPATVAALLSASDERSNVLLAEFERPFRRHVMDYLPASRQEALSGSMPGR